MIKKCEICGKEFQTIPMGGARKYCFDCVPMIEDDTKRTLLKRQALKKEGVKRLGGHCLKCGETRPYVLNFHHVNPEDKEFELSRLLANSNVKEFFSETSKCVLLCSNCHSEFHYLNDNYGITLEDYLGLDSIPLIKSEEEKLVENQKPKLNKLQEIQKQQDELMAKRKPRKHIYQGKIIAYLDSWVVEFESVKDCIDYFQKNILPTIAWQDISDGIRRVLNGRRKTYKRYKFEKDEE